MVNAQDHLSSGSDGAGGKATQSGKHIDLVHSVHQYLNKRQNQRVKH